MKFFPYTVIANSPEAEETFRLKLKPETQEEYSFIPGQYCYLKFDKDDETAKPFSIAAIPGKEYLEFCIKIYGPFTTRLSQSKHGQKLFVSSPQGSFTWSESIQHAAFLVGGLGIPPIISMLLHIQEAKQQPNLTLFYGNRTPGTKAFTKELDALTRTLSLKVIDIYSHLSDNHPWKGYRGFITNDILQKELPLLQKTVFFLIGPPIFLEKMKHALSELHVSSEKIRTETL